ALAWKLTQSPRLGRLWVDPAANAGQRELGTPCPESFDPQKRFFLKRWCERESIGLVVIGPDNRLAEGMADDLADPPRRLVFGPTRAAARIEWDKAWAKQIMRRAAVPTAEGRTFEHVDAALAYVRSRGEPVVVKASGLCLGKGVTVCDTRDDAEQAVHRFMVDRIHGDAGATIVVEERLEGPELSVLALVDGRTVWLLEPARDHKRVGEGDTGPNTGGMGAFSPVPEATPELLSKVARDIMLPTIDAMRLEGIEYRGVLYAGLMLTPAGPKVLEFNARFGDPETQVILPRLRGDLVRILWSTAAGSLEEEQCSIDPRCACCVVVCSGGYPGEIRKGLPIHHLPESTLAAEMERPQSEAVLCFQAGTGRDEQGRLVTAGGRVVGVTVLADTAERARTLATEAASSVRFDGAFHRRDIGAAAVSPDARRKSSTLRATT
ncbi:MAG: phosphoribosylamine--glycine ligase, partial [Phycisphaerae bacterium]|nr:phosphoribosylamine--glycine ligase [Phycisphaerae bacterium]